MKKIEIVTWFKCNCRCGFCASASADGNFSLEEIAGLLKKFRERGAEEVDFGGGEPTARNDLPAMAQLAAGLGYARIGVKSNGMRFCYPDYLKTCMEAGVNRFDISLWGHSPGEHDRMAGRNGAYEMTEMALKHLVDFGADVWVDYLLTARSTSKLPETMENLSRNVGVKNFNLWLFSIFGAGGGSKELMPRLSDAAKHLAEALGQAGQNIGQIRTSHIMPCLLKGREEIYFNIKELQLTIIGPGSEFPGEESPFEAGRHVEACRTCRLNDRCPGPRPEYVNIFGDREFKPIQ